jgi:hypothetical protein
MSLPYFIQKLQVQNSFFRAFRRFWNLPLLLLHKPQHPFRCFFSSLCNFSRNNFFHTLLQRHSKNNIFCCTLFSCMYNRFTRKFLLLVKIIPALRSAIYFYMIHTHNFRNKITHFENICNTISDMMCFCNCINKCRNQFELDPEFEDTFGDDGQFHSRRDKSYHWAEKTSCFWKNRFLVQHIYCSRYLWHTFRF